MDELTGSYDSRRDPYAGDLDKPKGFWGFRLAKRAATSTVVIMSLIVVLVLVVVANVNFGKGKPPPGAADISTNELMQELSGYQMDPVVAGAEANAKRRAYEKEVAAEKAAAKKAKAKAAALKKKREWEALKARMSHDPSAAENQQYAKKMSALKGWGGCWSSLLTMWNHESGWNEHAENPGSGAYGIPQALPGSKMASAGADWRNNAMTQIAWGLAYVGSRYGDPCKAWGFWQAHNWY
ncbi:lytic transglycosylase domain-containing protein [Actinomadura sp. DC4]|uniref:aggregation-promoting factor C-terminal-like domain-containing protein n=1 Tax=Actinomadura sp. DC4 TaxID=3055069 RepID=UPI0025B2799E|nr:lytic transglycosylase domain-containing protein [Actinomadura sp. DC4]MDN3351178.1 lytic transglycosylase domain-containing protein [Actinomadura sp. DC4]